MDLTFKWENCGANVIEVCKGIVIFQPLPSECQENPDCLEIIRENGIVCQHA